VALAQLHVVNLHPGADALVMVIDGDAERLLGAILPDDVLVELVENLLGSGNLAGGDTRLDGGLLFLDDLAAQVHALIADVDATRPRDQALHLILTFATERAAIRHASPLRIRHRNNRPLVDRRSRRTFCSLRLLSPVPDCSTSCWT